MSDGNTREDFENYAGQKFMSLMGLDAKLVRRGNPNDSEPDFIFLHNSNKIGVEITIASYSDLQIALDFFFAKKSNRPANFAGYKVPLPLNPTKALLQRIQERLDSKWTKPYTGFDHLYICIWVHGTIETKAEFQQIFGGLKLPLPQPKKQAFAVYYPADETSNYQIRKLV